MAYRNGGIGGPKMSSKADRSSSGVYSNTPKPVAKSKAAAAGLRRSGSSIANKDDTGVPGRVRVALRLRPRNAEESITDADFVDCVELQPEVKRLKLSKNNWDSDTYEFDDVLTEFSSQKRVYEVVAKPVVESVLEGYNGTVMAYGQTGTGKTFTLGSLGEEDPAARGIMVRAMEDILADVTPDADSVSVSYLQLYMETIQDLLYPGNDNIAIVEDPKTGDVSVPGATVAEIRDHASFVELLRLGEAHRFLANTKLNTESSRSHAILMVHVKRSVKGRHDSEVSLSRENGNASPMVSSLRPPIVRKSKLVVVDLAGSERIDKSGTARTSLIVTIGPSPRHRWETTSTIMFGQRAMKVENMVKLKEEFDYKSLCRRLDIEIDKLLSENERQRKDFEDEIERIRAEAQSRIAEADRNFTIALESPIASTSTEINEVNQNELLQNKGKSDDDMVTQLKSQVIHFKRLEAAESAENIKLRKMLEKEVNQKEKLEEEIAELRSHLLQLSFEADETRRSLDRGGAGKILSGLDSLVSQARHSRIRDSGNGPKASIAKLFEQVGLQKILSLLESEDVDVRVHAVKVVANLAAEGNKPVKSLLIEDGALPWIVKNANNEASPIRRHIELALCHLAQHEVNVKDMISEGALWELVRISRDCSREDIRSLAHRTLVSSIVFQAELRRLRVEL